MSAASPDSAILLCEALQRGEYCCVVAPRLEGQFTRERAVRCLREGGAPHVPTGKDPAVGAREAAAAAVGPTRGAVTIVVLNLAALGQCPSSEPWYEQLLVQLAPQLGLTEELAAFWRAGQPRSPLQRWMAALHEIVLPLCTGRLVLFVEETDALQELPFSADEFLSAIRECYNRRTRDPALDRLTFCLFGTVPLAALIRDPSTTWFNIGRRIEVTERGNPRAGTPAALHSSKPREAGKGSRAIAVLRRALDWIRGEPYCCIWSAG